MNTPEQELLAYLAEIQPRKRGFSTLRIDEPGGRAQIDLDASYDLFTSKCIFDDCTDEQARMFLKAFVDRSLSVGWSLSIQLSKLLAVRGRLVSDIMEPLLTTLKWNSCETRVLFLSYLAVRDNGAALAARLLDEVPDDGRDGLFLACYRLKSEELDRKLIGKFIEWDAEGWDGSGTGELHALQQFIAKWIGLYPYHDLERVIRLYFKHIFNLVQTLSAHDS
jgi:hypothetical protein